MDRRKFFVNLFAGALAAALPAKLLEQVPEKVDRYWSGTTVKIPDNPMIGNWVSYRFKYTVDYPPPYSPKLRFRRILAGEAING